MTLPATTTQAVPTAIVYYVVYVPMEHWGHVLDSEDKVAPLVDRYLYSGHQIQRVDLDDSGETWQQRWVALVAYEEFGDPVHAMSTVEYQRDRLGSGGYGTEVLQSLVRGDL